MRRAKTNDVWRELYKRRDFPVRSVRFAYADITALGSNSLELAGPMCLICGENGVGKTTLLRVLHRALVEGLPGWDDLQREFPPTAKSGAVTRLAVTILDAEGIAASHLGAANFAEYRNSVEPPAEVVFLDTATTVPAILRLLRSDQNLGDLIEGVSPRALDGDDLNSVRQMVGRDYEKVEIFEISDYQEFERLPYFRVAAGGTSYSSESMGTGELALLLLFWVIQASPHRSVLLLEEPESFIAPRSQRIFIDWLATQILLKQCFVVLSTHSGIIAERFPPEAISLCTRAGASTVIQHRPPTHVLVERLGILSHRRCLVLVEDAAAQALAGALLRTLEPRLHIECDIVVAGSNGAITKALIGLPRITSKRIVAIGLLDGDQGGLDTTGVHWPIVLLPGTRGPEALLRDICSEARLPDLMTALGLTQVQLETALGGVEGANDHDWLVGLVTAIETSEAALFRSLVPLWVESHQADAEVFIQRLADAARRPF
jgi:energy-coupling factor transporter ATP-binding protein EcfA2